MASSAQATVVTIAQVTASTEANNAVSLAAGVSTFLGASGSYFTVPPFLNSHYGKSGASQAGNRLT